MEDNGTYILFISPGGIISGISGPATRTTGVGEKLIGKSLSSLVSPESRMELDKALKKVLETGSEYSTRLIFSIEGKTISSVVSIRPVMRGNIPSSIILAGNFIESVEERKKEILEILESFQFGKEHFKKLLQIGRNYLVIRDMCHTFGRILGGETASAGAARNGYIEYRELVEMGTGRIYSLYIKLGSEEEIAGHLTKTRNIYHSPDMKNDPVLDPEKRKFIEADSMVAIPLFRENGTLSGIVEIYNPQKKLSREIKNILILTGKLYGLVLEGVEYEEKSTEIRKNLQRITRGLADVFELIRPDMASLAEASPREESRTALLRKIEELERIITGIAHFTNNHLAAITGYCEILKLKYSDQTELVERIDAILNIVERSSTLVRRLLSYGRKYAYNPVETNLNDFVRKLLPELQKLAGENLKLNVRFWTPAPSAQVDRTLVEKALRLLVENAVEATEGKGNILIHTGIASFSSEEASRKPGLKPGDYAYVAVSDDGPGIPPGLLDRIFLPFFTLKEHRDAMGLGLSAVFGIVKQHDGYVDVESTPGEGSTFKMYFPRKQKKPPSVDELSNSVPPNPLR